MSTPLRRHRFVSLAALAALLIALSAGLAACSGESSSSAAGGKLEVATTVAPITSIVAEHRRRPRDGHRHRPRGHELAHVRAEAERRRAAVDGRRRLRQRPRSSRTRPSELAEAEPQGRRGRSSSSARGRSRASQYIYDFSFPRSGGKPNPHLWTDPPLRRVATRAIVARRPLEARPGERAPTTRRNYAGSRRKVDELDRAMRTSFATIPPAKRKLLTYHDAYAYFGRDYGWKVIGAIQVSSFEDPTPKEVAEPDRPGAGASRCPRSSAPRCSRARCSSRSARRPA